MINALLLPLVGRPRVTQSWADLRMRGKYLEAMEKLLCQKPDDLTSFRDILSKNTWTVAYYLKPWPLAYIAGRESLTTCLIRYEMLALEHGTSVCGLKNKDDKLKPFEVFRNLRRVSTGHNMWCSLQESLKA